MPEFKRPVAGKFCWFEITTTDVPAAKRYYGELFGWTFDDMPMPDGSPYAMAKVKGNTVCGITTLTGEAKKMGAPPHLLSYVAVDDTDAIAAKVPGLGGKVLAPPMDAGPGRMAVIQDPTGGVFALRQARQQMGTWLYGETSALCWNELATTDVNKAGQFYGKLFGWQTETSPMGDMTYTVFKQGKEDVGGMMLMPRRMQGAPPAWCAYLQVTRADDSIARATKMGGKVIAPATDVPDVGRFAVLQDPQSAVFCILQPPAR